VRDQVQQVRSITALLVVQVVAVLLLAQVVREIHHQQVHHKEALVAMVVNLEILVAAQVVAHQRSVVMVEVQPAAQVVQERQMRIQVHQ
jgi:hypothetical protein